MRIGHGYDVHRLTEGRKLILGGVEIPYKYGLDGHSDADVLVHALMDAILGALALGDIGQHFPDTDPEYKGADSMKLLDKVIGFVDDSNYVFSNADMTICCQNPKLAPYIMDMRNNIAMTIGCDIDQISIKATTEEKLGFTGEGLGISATAVVLLEDL
ncbi:2-C-methyl-D-erythritol 2,4-cyclodiphosphate synthase [Ruminococcus sp.]|uniref:2-C-methyl-D-erythritol 2,4-cyclodiphosphate synthase n=1 Tax=Ruminococcus sp. TaxID=41978 RepID=UPI002585BAE6|nr:2-C-methyl-D-erythritol 2,4-cyclodiphosphate synthase [Ruminococcus sp.]MCR5020148.1 2-C-methyl-D-erythritol 2,4-cyclodiphosphate synthase [Ruminococcus sp.]